jgi:stage V sporulation protein K
MTQLPDSIAKHFASLRAAPPTDARLGALDQVWRELDGMVGLASVKSELARLVAMARVIGVRKKHDLPVAPISMHMVFAGPPGTGKTEVARKVGRILHACGMLRTSKFVEADKSTLIAKYTGQTAPRVRECIERAKDGVLFIDEAYALAGISPGDVDVKPGPFEQEAIDTLLKGMEDFRDQLVVIAAGYSAEMQLFLKANTGLKSRFARVIDFDSYGEEELTRIFRDMVARDQYRLGDGAERALREEMRSLYAPRDPKFGNARAVRAFYERVQVQLAMRLALMENLDTLGVEALTTIMPEDIAAAGLDR